MGMTTSANGTALNSPATPLSRASDDETGGFASPPCGGFALMQRESYVKWSRRCLNAVNTYQTLFLHLAQRVVTRRHAARPLVAKRRRTRQRNTNEWRPEFLTFSMPLRVCTAARSGSNCASRPDSSNNATSSKGTLDRAVVDVLPIVPA